MQYKKKQLQDGKTFIGSLIGTVPFVALFLHGYGGRSHLFLVSIEFKVPRNPSNIAF